MVTDFYFDCKYLLAARPLPQQGERGQVHGARPRIPRLRRGHGEHRRLLVRGRGPHPRLLPGPAEAERQTKNAEK